MECEGEYFPILYHVCFGWRGVGLTLNETLRYSSFNLASSETSIHRKCFRPKLWRIRRYASNVFAQREKHDHRNAQADI